MWAWYVLSIRNGVRADLTVSVYNAYNRLNPFFVFLEPEFRTIDAGGVMFDVPERITAKQQSLFPIIPSVT